MLIGAEPEELPAEGIVSAASLAELHFGIHTASGDARARRVARLGALEARFVPVPIDAGIARTYGVVAGQAHRRGVRPRQRALDLLIAATAISLRVPLHTRDRALAALSDVLDLRIVDR